MKAALSGEVAHMEVSHHRAAHGVRTRARTLAAATEDSSLAYLELRSRRLAKPSLLSVEPCEGSTKSHHSGPTNWERGTRNLRKASEPVVAFDKDEEIGETPVAEVDHFDVEATERNLQWLNAPPELTARTKVTKDNIEAGSREDANTSGQESETEFLYIRETSPGSTTRPTITSYVNDQRRHTISQRIPTLQDLEEFFGNTEQHHQQSLQEKYNFDFVNENPLPGRYDWVKPDFF